MAANRTNSEQFMIRLPDGMRERLKAEAENNGRSANAEIVSRLDWSFFCTLERYEELQADFKRQFKELQTLEAMVDKVEADNQMLRAQLRQAEALNEAIGTLGLELTETKNALNEQQGISRSLQQLIAESSARAHLDKEESDEALRTIHSAYDKLKEQTDYLETLKAELLELSKERYELDGDRDKIIDEQSKIIDHLRESNNQAVSIVRRFKIAIDAAARGDRSLIDRVVESARDDYHYEELLAQDLAQSQNSEE